MLQQDASDSGVAESTILNQLPDLSDQQDDEQLKLSDVTSAIFLTLQRAQALKQTYKSLIDDRAEVNVATVDEEKLQMLIFNLCREIQHIFLIFVASESFMSADKSVALDPTVQEKWA